jgi:protein gp37
MAELSAIGWTKSTLNFWIGCTKVSIGPLGGCVGCYAEVSTPSRAMKILWGPGNPRHRTAKANWDQALRWNKQAPDTEFAGRKGFWPVFVNSLSDMGDNEVPQAWRDDAWALMKATPNLTWIIVTKRIGNLAKMLPADWGTGYPNVWMLITVVTQAEADRDIPKLLHIPAVLHGLSIEPQMEAIQIERIDIDGHSEVYPLAGTTGCEDDDGAPMPDLPALGWVINGGESDQQSHKAREYNLDWGLSLAVATEKHSVPFFMKQLGHKPVITMQIGIVPPKSYPVVVTGKGENPDEWLVVLRRQEFPNPLPVLDTTS